MQRKGSAIWQGDLKTGKGTVSTDADHNVAGCVIIFNPVKNLMYLKVPASLAADKKKKR